MRNLLIYITLACLSTNVFADTFRCGRKIVKAGDTANMLVKKCGSPKRKFSGKETVNEMGRKSKVAVSNWVFDRRGKNDIIVSVRGGTVVKVHVE